jgi:hypothetical protein
MIYITSGRSGYGEHVVDMVHVRRALYCFLMPGRWIGIMTELGRFGSVMVLPSGLILMEIQCIVMYIANSDESVTLLTELPTAYPVFVARIFKSIFDDVEGVSVFSHSLIHVSCHFSSSFPSLFLQCFLRSLFHANRSCSSARPRHPRLYAPRFHLN